MKIPLISSNIWLQPGILMVHGAALDAALHKHHVIQIVCPTGKSRCTLKDSDVKGAVIINRNIQHQLNMESGWVILVEPQSDFGQKLSEQLKLNPTDGKDKTAAAILDFLPLPELLLIPATSCADQIEPAQNYRATLNTILTNLGLDIDLSISAHSASLTDTRIQTLLNDLDNCLVSDCLKPSYWAAAEVASQLDLSEGRFLHLFREQMGIAWRPYLLWRRMICAISAMMKGRSATEAAYIAGFSDSSHLSRTFRAHFGMSIRDAQAIIK
jgi:AraC-like DNA-binding protein